jgi:hypothetical protein
MCAGGDERADNGTSRTAGWRTAQKKRRSYDQFLQAVRAHACASLNYRLSGDDVLSKIYVAHLSGALRVVTAFSADDAATILLVGPHDDRDPFMDVYSQLYGLAGLTEPPAAERTKPPRCSVNDGKPPIPDGKLLADLARQERQSSGAAKRRARNLRASVISHSEHVPGPRSPEVAVRQLLNPEVREPGGR